MNEICIGGSCPDCGALPGDDHGKYCHLSVSAPIVMNPDAAKEAIQQMSDFAAEEYQRGKRDGLMASADLLAACKAWADYFDYLDRNGVDVSDPLLTERRKYHGKRIAMTREAIRKAEASAALKEELAQN